MSVHLHAQRHHKRNLELVSGAPAESITPDDEPSAPWRAKSSNGGSGSPRRGPNFVAPISHEEPAQAIHRLVPSAVATTLEMRTEDPRLVAGLRDKRMLLLLDNSSMSQYHRITDLERAGRLDLTCRILDADALSKW